MRALVGRALGVAAATAAALLLVLALVLVVLDARDAAASADERARATIASVLAVTTDHDAVRTAIARTPAGTEGRLAVYLPDGSTIGVGTATPRLSTGLRVATSLDDVAIVVTTAPADVVTTGLVVRIALLLLEIHATHAFDQFVGIVTLSRINLGNGSSAGQRAEVCAQLEFHCRSRKALKR